MVVRAESLSEYLGQCFVGSEGTVVFCRRGSGGRDSGTQATAFQPPELRGLHVCKQKQQHLLRPLLGGRSEPHAPGFL